MFIYKHIDECDKFYQPCRNPKCNKDILEGDNIVVLWDFPDKITLHRNCYEDYMVGRFKKRYLIAGVNDE